MSGPETETPEPLASVVAELRRETQRLTALGDVLGQAESDWFEKFEQLERAERRTERSRRKLAIRAARLRRERRRTALAKPASVNEAAAEVGQSVAGEAELELAVLRVELAEAAELLKREQIRSEELETQNASLATQLAATQVHGQTSGAMHSQMHESLSWEERKAAILQQLHREDADEPLDAGERESLRDIVAKTDREIRKRDAEIAELQQLLEHQSTAVGDSVAVGAAAIAQMIDADDLVREEREKLQAIKAEWQEKLRQAEIDLSLERAKLARERRELEQKHADLQQQLAEAAELHRDASPADQPRRRRWLTQLGLSDEE
ncbi:coiled-coil domain-containing protein [Candidatus Laterigemmans baculatus]|uniref:hypothetical protein n=1 Tax=Candidatus Laterigemmans baculatus TaxID=2770505 RepID=UPI0013DBE9C1|nr:hypothetical protein [Candidatus Laterigemmans baculatus]